MKICFFIVCLLLSAPTLLHAKEHYTYVDGLIDNKVTTVAVNREMVFCGTPLGGSRFDGAQWESFLEGVEITKVVIAPNNHIWVGARQGLWEGYDGKWMQRIAGVSVNDIVINQKGDIWIATDSNILSSRDGGNWEGYAHMDEQLAQIGRRIAASLKDSHLAFGKMCPLRSSTASPYGSEISPSELHWFKNYVTALALKGEDEIWVGVYIAFEVGTNRNFLLLSCIGFFDGHRWSLLEPTLEVRLYNFSEEARFELRDEFFQVCRWKTPEAKGKSDLASFLLYACPITAISVDKNDYLWYSRWNRGVFRYKEAHLTRYWSEDIDRPEVTDSEVINGVIIRDFPTETDVTDKIHDNLVYDIEIDGEGNIWFATMRDVSRFDGASWTRVRSSPEAQPLEVFALAPDESYNIWAGTSNGLYRFESRWMVYPPLPRNATPVDFQIDEEGDVWVATWGAGIHGLVKPRRAWELNRLVPYLPDCEAHQVYSMLVDRKRGYIWCSSQTLGVDRELFKVELKTGTTEDIKDERLINDAITAMVLDSNGGSLWLGGRNGLNLYNPDTEECRSWSLKEHIDFPPDDIITALYLAHDGKLWIGSRDSGVICYDRRMGTWENFTPEDGLLGSQVNAISEDELGGIWVATLKGASRFDSKVRKWHPFTMRDGLAGDRVYDLKAVGSNIWFATDGGVSKFDGTKWRTYDRRDGLPGNNVYKLAVKPSGTLWVGYRGGQLAVRQAESIPPDTLFISNPPERVGVASASFKFQGRDMGTSFDEFLYSYRLAPEGEIPSNYSAEWLNWSKYTLDNRVFYEGLRDGRYTFYVRAIDKDDNVDTTPAIYTFTVDTKPPITLINQPVDNSWVSGKVQIVGTVSDTDLKRYQILVKPSEGEGGWMAVGEGDTSKWNEPLGFWDVSGLSGKYRVQLKAEDKLEHTSAYEIKVFIENQPPHAQITYPTDGAYVGAMFSIRGTAMDANFSRYTLECEEVGTNIAETLIESRTPMIDGTLFANFRTEPRIGDYIIRLNVLDMAGNKSSDSVLIHIDKTPPEIYDLSPAGGTVIADNSPLIHTFLKDGESGIDENSIVLEVDGRTLETSFNPDEQLLLCQIGEAAPLSEGAHKLSVRCNDKAGNQSSTIVVFTVDSKGFLSSLQRLILRQFKAIFVYSPSEYGPIELKRAESEIWEPLKAGMILTGEDWVRMPPSSILRLKPKGEAVGERSEPTTPLPPFFKGDEGVGERSEPTDGDEIPPLVGGKQKRVASLFLADNVPATIPSDETSDNLKLGFLRMVKPVPPFERVPNVGKALWIFNWLRGVEDAEIQWLSSEIKLSSDSPLLYYMLLKNAGIPARFEMKDEGIYLLLLSGVPQSEANKITVNPLLYLVENSSSTVWIPLYITSSTSDFVCAWYEGARIACKLGNFQK